MRKKVYIAYTGGTIGMQKAALAKMAYLFSRNLPPEVIKENMQTDLQGELSNK